MSEITVERKYTIDDRVTKTKGSSWTGAVVGFYSTSLTPVGYAVESENEPGSVQIYPESALELLPPAQADYEVIGTTSDGVDVLAPATKSERFTSGEVRAAIAAALTAPQAGDAAMNMAKGWSTYLKKGASTADFARAIEAHVQYALTKVLADVARLTRERDEADLSLDRARIAAANSVEAQEAAEARATAAEEKSRLPDWVDGFLNRRTAVEVILRNPLQCRVKGLPLPEPMTPEQMNELANKLSIPEDFKP